MTKITRHYKTYCANFKVNGVLLTYQKIKLKMFTLFENMSNNTMLFLLRKDVF